jgi:hypothetical protein
MTIGGIGLAGILLALLAQLRIGFTFAGQSYGCSAIIPVAVLFAALLLLVTAYVVRTLCREMGWVKVRTVTS